MNEFNSTKNKWKAIASSTYDPIKIASIDGIDGTPHDKAVIRALQAAYKPNRKVLGDPKCTIFVARLHPKTDQKMIEKHFSKYGTIVRCRLVRDVITGFSKCYAFVEYSNRRDALKAYGEAFNLVIDDQRVMVDFEHERLMISWKPRRLGGGFGGRKGSGQLRFGCRDRPWKMPILAKTNAQSSGESSSCSAISAEKRKRDNIEEREIGKHRKNSNNYHKEWRSQKSSRDDRAAPYHHYSSSRHHQTSHGRYLHE